MRQNHELSMAESPETSRRAERRARVARSDGGRRSRRARRIKNCGSASRATRAGQFFFAERGKARRVGRTLVARPAGGLATWTANSEEESGLHCGRDPHSGARNRSEHGAIFRSGRSAAEPTALSALRTTCHAARKQAQLRHRLHFFFEFPGLAE